VTVTMTPSYRKRMLLLKCWSQTKKCDTNIRLPEAKQKVCQTAPCIVSPKYQIDKPIGHIMIELWAFCISIILASSFFFFFFVLLHLYTTLWCGRQIGHTLSIIW
jgi:hypothetical protein